MNSTKPKKRVMLYWFVDYGFFFLIIALYCLGTFLRYFTNFNTLTVYVMSLTIIVLIMSLLYLLYKWLSTEYFFLEKSMFLKEGEEASRIAYEDIKDVGYYGSALQHMIGTTNLRIRTKNNKNYYIRGVRDYKEVEDEILKRIR